MSKRGPLRLVLLTLVAAGPLLLAPASSHATSVLRLSFQDLAVRSDLVVAGTVTDIKEAALRDGSMAYTFVTLTDLDVLAGTYSEAQLTIRLEGGHPSPEFVIHVEGMPEFASGERVVLFLLQGNGVLPCPITGWTQGKLRLVTDARDRTVLTDAAGHIIHSLDEGRFVLSAEASLPPGAGPGSMAGEDSQLASGGLTLVDEPGPEGRTRRKVVTANRPSKQRLSLSELRSALVETRRRVQRPRTDADRALAAELRYAPDPRRRVASASPRALRGEDGRKPSEVREK